MEKSIFIKNNEVARKDGYDNSSIKLDNNDKLQTVGVIDNNSGNTNKMWTGTLAQYNAIQNKDANTYYYITDDEGTNNYREKVEVIIDTTVSVHGYGISTLTGNKAYKLRELIDLTITACDTFDEETIIYFSSGTTATTISMPDSIINLGDAPTMTTSSNVNSGTCEANKSYIISVLNNIAVWKAY